MFSQSSIFLIPDSSKYGQIKNSGWSCDLSRSAQSDGETRWENWLPVRNARLCLHVRPVNHLTNQWRSWGRGFMNMGEKELQYKRINVEKKDESSRMFLEVKNDQ